MESPASLSTFPMQGELNRHNTIAAKVPNDCPVRSAARKSVIFSTLWKIPGRPFDPVVQENIRKPL
jgi:hypothetical protein